LLHLCSDPLQTLFYPDELADLGSKVGNVICNTSACADDVTLNSFNEMESQVLIDTAAEYAKQERYQLQHSKANSIRMHSNRKQNSSGQQI
jgi:hypothetical protein